MPQKKNPVSTPRLQDLIVGLAGNHPRQIRQSVWTDVWAYDDLEEYAFDLQ